MQLTKKQLEFLSKKISDDIFVNGATRVELKKSTTGKVEDEISMGGWNKEALKQQVSKTLSQVLEFALIN